jgi:hypothetical protein
LGGCSANAPTASSLRAKGYVVYNHPERPTEQKRVERALKRIVEEARAGEYDLKKSSILIATKRTSAQTEVIIHLKAKRK